MYLVVYDDFYNGEYTTIYSSLDDLLKHYHCYTIEQILLNENKNLLKCTIYQISYKYTLKDEFYRY